MAFSFTYPTPLPSTKGWGPGWSSNDQTCSVVREKIVPDPIFAGGVHRRIKRLVVLLSAEIEKRGYHFQDPGCWGFGCRGTKGGSGDTPSFHSWGLALDVNAPQNPMNFDDPAAAFAASDIAQHNKWLVRLMREYGFFWLGNVGDPMHFSFCGTPKDADRMTAKAEANLVTVGYRFGGKTYKTKTFATRALRKSLKDAKVGATRSVKVVER